MRDRFQILVHQPAEVLLETLARYCKDWHESRLPSELRDHGFNGCRLSVQHTGFDLRLVPQGRGVGTRCLGQVEQTPDGCRLLAIVEPTPSTAWGAAVWFTVVAATAAMPAFRNHGFLAGIGEMMVVLVVFVIAWSIAVALRVSRDAPRYRMLLQHGVQMLQPTIVDLSGGRR